MSGLDSTDSYSLHPGRHRREVKTAIPVFTVEHPHPHRLDRAMDAPITGVLPVETAGVIPQEARDFTTSAEADFGSMTGQLPQPRIATGMDAVSSVEHLSG